MTATLAMSRLVAPLAVFGAVLAVMVALNGSAASPPALSAGGDIGRPSGNPLRDARGFDLAREVSDPFANYDPERARAALDRVFGILRGVDKEALKAELREQRAQDSRGRPA